MTLVIGQRYADGVRVLADTRLTPNQHGGHLSARLAPAAPALLRHGVQTGRAASSAMRRLRGFHGPWHWTRSEPSESIRKSASTVTRSWAAGEVLGFCRSSFTRPFATAGTANRRRDLFHPPSPEPCVQDFQVHGSPVIRSQEFSILACRLPYSLPPDRPVPLRHVSGFPGPRLLRGLRRRGARARRRSRGFRSSYVRAWVRPSTHPYARDHLPVSHRTGLPGAKDESSTCGDAALSQPSGGAARVPIGIGLEAV